MLASAFKRLLPNRPMPLRVWRGPFRGARLLISPRDSMRKVLGLYEHELNGWLEEALRRVNRVLDVGANDGYFTFGCAAAFRRSRTAAEIVAFEPRSYPIGLLRESMAMQPASDVRISIVQTVVGRATKPGVVSLDGHKGVPDSSDDHNRTMIKIDVEGAELEVIEGARTWLNASNYFVIEVHRRDLLDTIQRVFAERELKLLQVNQAPLRFLGREARDADNWWLVSDLRRVPHAATRHASSQSVNYPGRTI
jgi:hypothetical protein